MPIVSVTPLGSSAGDTATAIDQIIDYLQRGAQRRPEPNASIVGYYADTPTSPGVWRGRGVNAEQLVGPVDPEMLRSLLEGAHPYSGETLIDGRGSAGRARSRQSPPAPIPNGERLDTRQAAEVLGVGETYVRRVAIETERNPDTETPLRGERDAAGRWWFNRAELERFATTRTAPKVVVAFDVTVSFEKSISLAWARATPEQRRLIEQALDAGTNAAVTYLEDQAVAIRTGGRGVKADGLWAASYRHMTNRNLEPQLHDHVVIANIAAADGTTQTLDSRLLHHHAKTAGYVAGAVTRRHLTDSLGVAWQPVERGLADLAGITRPMINAFSTRRAEITTLTDELGLDSASARNVAALATRAPKTEPADWERLEAQWTGQLDTLGLTAEHWSTLQNTAVRRPLEPADERHLLAWLNSPAGVTKANAVFSRRDVVQAIVEWDGTHGNGMRLDYDTLERLTDAYLASPQVVSLTMTPGQITRTGETRWYSTTTMLDLERDVIAAYTHARTATPSINHSRNDPTASDQVERPGINHSIHRLDVGINHSRTHSDGGIKVSNGSGINHSVAHEYLDAARAEWERSTGHRLGVDQAAMVKAITTSPARFLPVIGPAGSGKTAALDVAARAWTAAGLTPIGASVTGTATEVLAEATGMPSRTVASLIAELEAGGQPFTDRTVLVVDEASTLSNRDHHRLVQAIEQAGGIMRTIGDPAQHRAVEAGGLWAHLVTDLADQVPVLTVNRRQAAPAMSEVRLANDDYRRGLVKAAVGRLQADERIVTAPTAGELLDHLAADWYADRLADPGARSRMMAESHSVRRQLNQRAQALLAADGTLTGPPVELNGEQFRVGDQVITRTQDRSLRHPDGAFLRNGATGTITAITSSDGTAAMTVDFDRHGPLTLPYEFLTRHIRPGLDGGLAPAYAITTHAAQGATMRTGRMLTTDTSSREGVYVGLTRGTTDTRLYLVASDELADRQPSDVGLPILRDTRTALEQLTAHLAAPDQATVVAATDPDARHVHLLRDKTLDELRADAPSNLATRRALRHVADTAARHAISHPDDTILERLGPRPAADSPKRPAWDDAVTRTITHAVIHGPNATTETAQRSTARVSAALARYDTLHAATDLTPVVSGPTFDTTEVARLAERLRAARSTLPLDDALIAHLHGRLETHIDHAVKTRADYLTELLGERSDEPRAADRWDRAAHAVERARHHAGITPERGAFEGTSPLERAIGDVEHAERRDVERTLHDLQQLDRNLIRGRHR